MKPLLLLPVLLLSLLPCAAHAQSGITIQQGTTTRKILLLVVKSVDHITADTGDTLTVTLSKNGGAFAAPAGTVAEVANGWYALTPTAADTNALGPLVIHVSSVNGDPSDLVENIAAVNQDDASLFGLTGIGTLAGQNTITGKTNLIATNAADSPNTVTAQSTTTSTSTAVAALPAANATAVWGSTTRALTDKANFALVSTEYANIAAVTTTYGFDGPPAGTILTLTITRNGSSQPVLTWTADPAATLYKVYRSTDGANYTVIATPATGTLTYTDTARPAGATVYYHITSTH